MRDSISARVLGEILTRGMAHGAQSMEEALKECEAKLQAIWPLLNHGIPSPSSEQFRLLFVPGKERETCDLCDIRP